MIWLNGYRSRILSHLPGSLIPPLHFEKSENSVPLKTYSYTLSIPSLISVFIFNFSLVVYIQIWLHFPYLKKQKHLWLPHSTTSGISFLPHIKLLKRIFCIFYLLCIAFFPLFRLFPYSLSSHYFTYIGLLDPK